MLRSVVLNDKQRALIAEAERWLGTRETGANAGAAVEAFQRAVDGRANGEPWCMAFVQYCLKRVDARVAGAASWLFPTEHVLTCWNKTTLAARLQTLTIAPGDLIVWQHWAGTPALPTASGHIGIVTRAVGPGIFETIEGNTTADGDVNREGDGVFRRLRDVNRQAKGTLRFKGGMRPWSGRLK